MTVLTDFSKRVRVKVIGLEPERFKHEPRALNSILEGTHPLIGKEGVVTSIDELNQRIWVSFDGQIEWFDPWDLEIIKENKS